MSSRYAIYFAPEPNCKLAHFGARALGYDAESGELVPFWPDLPTSADAWDEWTRSPRQYGFHATLKPPFFLKDAVDERKLAAALRHFASSQGGIEFELQVGQIGSFVALIPHPSPTDLNALAADCVVRFDAFRAPPTPKERERRLARRLTERQREYFENWGYPYVLDEFRFHMTLTDSLSPEAGTSACDFLAERFASTCDTRVRLGGLALFRQDHEASRFRIIERMPFGT